MSEGRDSLFSGSPAKALSVAKDACGDKAVAAAERGDHAKAQAWTHYAVAIGSLFNEVTHLMADEVRG